MSSRKVRDFEFRLGKMGLILFVFVTSIFLLSAFIFGVIVGQNIESYPEKIARSVPGMTKKKIVRKTLDIGEIAKKSEEKDFELTFYDALTSKSEESRIEKEKKPSVNEKYVVQVASFKDKKKAEALHKRLLDMGYNTVIDKIELNSKGRWFRIRLVGFVTHKDAKKVAVILEKKIKGLKCMIMKK